MTTALNINISLSTKWYFDLLVQCDSCTSSLSLLLRFKMKRKKNTRRTLCWALFLLSLRVACREFVDLTLVYKSWLKLFYQLSFWNVNTTPFYSFENCFIRLVQIERRNVIYARAWMHFILLELVLAACVLWFQICVFDHKIH